MSEARDFDTWASKVAREPVALGTPQIEAHHVPYNEDGMGFGVSLRLIARLIGDSVAPASAATVQ
ncbi:hypothetical protein IHE33_07800 [Mycetohabitans endofungorum]|uniref:hypothetical protein n=1 Tax=Mycetohabitans endofungorum TaxID=417203 RepID=UPI0030CB5837